MPNGYWRLTDELDASTAVTKYVNNETFTDDGWAAISAKGTDRGTPTYTWNGQSITGFANGASYLQIPNILSLSHQAGDSFAVNGDGSYRGYIGMAYKNPRQLYCIKY